MFERKPYVELITGGPIKGMRDTKNNGTKLAKIEQPIFLVLSFMFCLQ